MKITVNDSLIPKKPNAPLDHRSRIESNGTLQDIVDKIIELGNPFEGQIVYDTTSKSYYSVSNVVLDSQLNTTISIKSFNSSEQEFATKEEIINLFI